MAWEWNWIWWGLCTGIIPRCWLCFVRRYSILRVDFGYFRKLLHVLLHLLKNREYIFPGHILNYFNNHSLTYTRTLPLLSNLITYYPLHSADLGCTHPSQCMFLLLQSPFIYLHYNSQTRSRCPLDRAHLEMTKDEKYEIWISWNSVARLVSNMNCLHMDWYNM